MSLKFFIVLVTILNLFATTTVSADGAAWIPNGYNRDFIRKTALDSSAIKKLQREQPHVIGLYKSATVVGDLSRNFNLASRAVEFDFSVGAVECKVTYWVNFADENTVSSVTLGNFNGSCSKVLNVDLLLKRE